MFFKLSYLRMKVACVLPLNPFIPKISFSDSPYSLPYNYYGVSWENLVFDQLIIPKSMFFSFLVTCLLDIVLVL